MLTEQKNPAHNLIGSPVSSLSFNEQIDLIVGWGQERLSKVVCVANVHMLIEATKKPDFSKILHRADLVTPDGMPLVWMLKLMGSRKSQRVAGLDLMKAACEKAEILGVSVFFLGSTDEVLAKIGVQLKKDFPSLKVAGMESPPFRQLTEAEDNDLVKTINSSGAGIVFVSLGCPKQEKWMAEHAGRVRAAMVGIGAVFPLYAGLLTRAPGFIRASGLEWLYRLLQEPKRLWKRYFETIPPFIWLALKQLLSPGQNPPLKTLR
jgi:N-acetylglucosaminyldiphosphoundecaprenol N-acetyl-beta-D-mannosaminyltransferase